MLLDSTGNLTPFNNVSKKSASLLKPTTIITRFRISNGGFKFPDDPTKQPHRYGKIDVAKQGVMIIMKIESEEGNCEWQIDYQTKIRIDLETGNAAIGRTKISWRASQGISRNFSASYMSLLL